MTAPSMIPPFLPDAIRLEQRSRSMSQPEPDAIGNDLIYALMKCAPTGV
jgi:hypothetical protein